MNIKLSNTDRRVKLTQELPEVMRSGGENRPFEYPRLYQIHAGDWRISYAVEHNRLAILVLEVLSPEGQVLKDAAHEKLTKKMKIKLLDLPEQGKEMAPEEVGKRLKVKLLEVPPDAEDEQEAPAVEAAKPKIRLLNMDATAPTEEMKAKLTPLDSPSPQ